MELNSSLIAFGPSMLSPFFSSQLFGVAIGAIIGGLSSYFTNRQLEYHRTKIEDQKLRQQVYSQLVGEKMLFIQLYVSYFWMFAQRESCKTYCVLKNLESPQDKSRYNQMQEEHIRAKKKCEDLALEVARGSRDFWKIIGLVQTAFPNTINLDELIENMMNTEKEMQNFEVELLKSPTEIQTEDQINTYYDKIYKKEFKLLIENKLEPCIDALLKYLKEVTYQETHFSQINLRKKSSDFADRHR